MTVVLLNRVEDTKMEFIKHFLDMSFYKKVSTHPTEQPYLQMPDYKGGLVEMLLRYYKKGDAFAVEDGAIEYPSVTIHDFTPTINEKLKYPIEYVESMAWETLEGSKVGAKVYLPIPMIYMFQVSAITKVHKHIEAAQNWFYDKFSIGFNGAGFLFKKVETPYGDLGIPVPYKAEMVESERPDRKFELDVTFTLYPFVHIKKEITEETVESIELILNQMTLDGVTDETFRGLV